MADINKIQNKKQSMNLSILRKTNIPTKTQKTDKPLIKLLKRGQN